MLVPLSYPLLRYCKDLGCYSYRSLVRPGEGVGRHPHDSSQLMSSALLVGAAITRHQCSVLILCALMLCSQCYSLCSYRPARAQLILAMEGRTIIWMRWMRFLRIGIWDGCAPVPACALFFSYDRARGTCHGTRLLKRPEVAAASLAEFAVAQGSYRSPDSRSPLISQPHAGLSLDAALMASAAPFHLATC